MERAVKRSFARSERWAVTAANTNGRCPGRSAILALAGFFLLSLGWAAASPNGPMAIALSADGARLYVAHMTIRSNRPVSTVSALDTATMQVVATFRAPQDPMLYSLAVSPDGQRLYLGEYGTVALLDPRSFATMATIKAGPWPLSMAFRPDGERLYVANGDPKPSTSNHLAGGLTIIDTATNKALTVLDVSPLTEFVTVSPDGRRIYALGCDNCQDYAVPPMSTLKVIDADTLQVSVVREPGRSINRAALSPDGTRLYVTSSALWGWVPRVDVYDTAANEVVGRVAISDANHVFADQPVVSPDGQQVYLTMANSPDAIRVLDAGTLHFTGKIKLPDEARLLTISPDGKRLYSVGGLGEAVSVTAIDTATLLPTASVKLSPAVAR
jgi:DNA-binding beta-propeller fold protein YncE